MIIGFATIDDFQQLYTMGKSTPEFMVSATEDFMKKQGFNEGHTYVWMDKAL